MAMITIASLSIILELIFRDEAKKQAKKEHKNQIIKERIIEPDQNIIKID